jgi:hypothetical protein
VIDNVLACWLKKDGGQKLGALNTNFEVAEIFLVVEFSLVVEFLLVDEFFLVVEFFVAKTCA